MFCEKCGNELKENAKFCSKCGTKIMPKSAVEIPTEGNANDQKDTRFNVKGVLMVIVITLILVIGPTLGVLYYVRGSESSSNTKTVNEEETEEEQPASDIESAEAEKPGADQLIWKEKYLDYLRSISDADTYEYDLIYLDDDDIPELYIDTQVMAGGTWLITCYNGKIQDVDTGEYDGLSYIERSGLIHISTGHGGGYEDRIVKLKKGEFSILKSGYYSQMPDGNDGVDEQYCWDGEEVTSEEYFTGIEKAYDKTKEQVTTGQYTYHELYALLTGEESTTNKEMSAEEMYQAASDMIGDRVGLVYGSYFWSFCKYEGNPADCFWGYGDMSIPYTSITEVSGDTVMTGGARIKVVNPWILEVFEQDSAEIVYVYSGEISAIDEYMRETGTPYIISDSDCVKIDDNMAFDSDVARLARNEIYARHGRKFKDPELQAFFNNREWYHGTIEPEDFSEDLLNEVEKYNVLLLSS